VAAKKIIGGGAAALVGLPIEQSAHGKCATVSVCYWFRAEARVASMSR
jgi:hypothetical protein